jgi:metallophosphoesterase superfamily enzyme
MQSLSSSQAIVAENVVLDGRLALFHKRESWLAVSDFHFGYELSQRQREIFFGSECEAAGRDCKNCCAITIRRD